MKRQELSTMNEQYHEKHRLLKGKVRVCCGTGCVAAGSEKILKQFQQVAKDKGVDQDYDINMSGCMGACTQGPLVRITPENTIYEYVKPEQAEKIIAEHVINKKPIESMILFHESREKPFVNTWDDPFFKKQHHIVLGGRGEINPESIEDYIGANDGYKAIEKALFLSSPEDVISEVKHSRLRGRGGAGFPTGIKWETVYKYVSDQKYVICNGDEGDPGAFMDRSVLESNPHRVLEGMIIAGYAIGANKGYAYIRGEYELAVKRFELAIKQAKKFGLLGANIMGSNFSFEVEVRIGAGAFVCGEETALIASIEGKRGMPRPRPPFPAESGLWGKPTLINNVESLAAIAPIVIKGGEWFSAIGTPKSAGTKVFALTGKVMNSGLIEVPMGTTLREIIFEIGGGIPDGRKFKAAQTGGPSGGCIPEKHLDVKVDYESLMEVGSIMGSGGLIVMDDTSDMVDVARFFMEFCMDESCGKCVPCRVGTKMMFDLLTKICAGQGTLKDIQRLEELSVYVKETSLCGLGMSAPNPLLSTLRYFKNEYLAHIERNKALEGGKVGVSHG